MRSLCHLFSDTSWSKIAPWSTTVADSSTYVAQSCSLNMQCLLEFQAHTGQVAAALLPNLCMSNRLLSLVAVQPPARCSLMTFLLKHTKPLFFLWKTEPTRRSHWPGRALLGPKTTLVGPWCALIILLSANRFAISRSKVHSYEVTCISCPSHCLCYAKTMESLVFL